MMHLSSLVSEHEVFFEKMEQDVRELADSNEPIIVFGTGKRGRRVLSLLRRFSIFVTAFCETSSFYRPGKVIDGKPVYKYEELAENGIKCNLIMAASGEGCMDVVQNQKISAKIYYLNNLPTFFCMTPEWVHDHIEALDETYRLLADEVSRTVFLSYLDRKAHCVAVSVPPMENLGMGDEQRYSNLYDPRRTEHNTLIDCGAFTGNPAERYLRFVRAYDRKGKVYSFEPDATSFQGLKITAKKVKEIGLGDIECFPYGVGEKNGESYFSATGDIDSFCLSGDSGEAQVVRVQIVALDEVLRDVPISMITMNIEGNELSALKGAQKIISEQAPLLAIDAYHRKEDLITLPQYIAGISQRSGKKYELYLRARGFSPVLYAVPE